jgi:hypothetical protein
MTRVCTYKSTLERATKRETERETIHSIRIITLFIALVLVSGCSYFKDHGENHSTSSESAALTVNTAKKVGVALMKLPHGVHLINDRLPQPESESASIPRTSPPRALSLLVHGYKSRGYEWVYAATHLARRGPVYLFRWDWELCPKAGAAQLSAALSELSAQYPQSDVRALGHSYGGVILAISAAQYRGDSPLHAHLIASPLAGHSKLEARCQTSISDLTAPHRRLAGTDNTETAHTKMKTADDARSRLLLTQWRTVKEIDGAFKEMDHDPQVVDWRGDAFTLPKTYRGKRLGHNWSISAAVDSILKDEAETGY